MLSPLSPFMEKETEAGDGGGGEPLTSASSPGCSHPSQHPVLGSSLAYSSSLWGWVGDGAGKQDFLGRTLWLIPASLEILVHLDTSWGAEKAKVCFWKPWPQTQATLGSLLLLQCPPEGLPAHCSCWVALSFSTILLMTPFK